MSDTPGGCRGRFRSPKAETPEGFSPWDDKLLASRYAVRQQKAAEFELCPPTTLRERRFAVRCQHVEIAVLRRDVDPAARHGDRRRDRGAERRRERPCFAAGQRHDMQLAV